MTTTAISAVVPRKRCTVLGTIVSVTAILRPSVRLNVALDDGTGTLELRFLSRTEIPGMAPGRRLRVEGTPMREGDVLLMLNPLYTFLADDGHSAG